jgi:hypothetical protein
MALTENGLRYFLFKLVSQSEDNKSTPWAVYEYGDSAFEKKLHEGQPFRVSDVYSATPSHTHNIGNVYYVATTGDLRIDEFNRAWIT